MNSEDDKKENTDQQEEQPSPDSDITQTNDAVDGLDLGFTDEQDELHISPDAALQHQVDEMKEDMLRLQAEMQNTRRRAEKDVANAHKFALERFAGELLSVVDNLERALASVSDDEVETPLVEGLKLTYRSFIDTLAKFNIEQVNPENEVFDPQLHEAVTMIDTPDAEANTVVDVVQKGYSLNGRLIRAAMVVVAK